MMHLSRRLRIVAIIMMMGLCVLFLSPPMTRAADDTAKADQGSSGQSTADRKLGGHLTFYGDLAGRVNPAALGLLLGINYRDVYGYSEKYDAASSYWQTGLSLGISPAYGQTSVHVEWMPFIIFSLRAQGDYYRFFGRSNSLLSFSSAGDPFGENANKDRHDEEIANGQRLMLQPTLQGKIGGFLLRNQTDMAYYRFSGRGPYFLDQEYYTLLKDGDYLISNRTEILYEAWKDPRGKTLLAGPYYDATRADDARITQQKIGGTIYWVPADKLWGTDRPRIYLKGGYHLQDPNFQGQLYMTLGVGFDVDL